MDEPELPMFEGFPTTPPGLGEACSLVGPLEQVVPETAYHAHRQLRDGLCAWRNWIFVNQKFAILRFDPRSSQVHTNSHNHHHFTTLMLSTPPRGTIT
jgi:hypothetical protein